MSENNEIKIAISRELFHLFVCAVKDLDARLGILFRECRHMQMNIAYLTCNKNLFKLLKTEANYKNDNQSPATIEEVWRVLCEVEESNTLSWVTRNLAVSMQAIKINVWKDLTHLRNANDELNKWRNCDKENDEYYIPNPVPLKTMRWFLYVQTVLRQRAGEYARSLGRSQHRLGQTLENRPAGSHTLSVRRRKEKGLNDKYLSMLCRWVHRDMYLLATTMMGRKCDYPFDNIPVAVQFWDYHHTSHQYNINEISLYEKWRDLIYDPRRSKPILLRKNNTEANLSNSENLILESNEPEKLPAYAETIIIQLGYWMLERVSIQNILGHELAHPVIRSALGSMDPHVLSLGKKLGDFGEFARSILNIVDNWLTDTKDHSAFCQDILADILAVSRFGYSYLYSWFLEFLDETRTWATHPVAMDEFDNLANDEFLGGPIAFPPAELPLKNDADLNFGSFPDNKLKAPSPFCEDYLRGRVILAWLDKMGLKKEDVFATTLHKAIHDYLEIILVVRFATAQKSSIVTRAAAESLETLILDDNFDMPKNAANFLNSMNNDSATGNNWSVWQQQVPKNVREKLNAHFIALIKDGKNEIKYMKDDFTYGQFNAIKSISLFGTTDIAWRLEWLLEDPSYISTYLMAIYVSQVTPPQMILRSITNGDNIKTSSTTKFSGDEVINPCLWSDIERCRLHWLESFQKYVTKGKLNHEVSGSYLEGVEIKVNDSIINWILHSEPNGRISSQSNYYMDLMSASDTQGVSYLNDSIEKQDYHDVFLKILGKFEWLVVVKYPGLYNPNNSGFSLKDPTFRIHPINASNDNYLPYYDRRRLLRSVVNRVQLNRASPDLLPSMIIFIELKIAGLRVLFLNWISHILLKPQTSQSREELLFNNSFIELYRSSGWEDFIIMLAPKSLMDYYTLKTWLYDNPLVNRTYTMLTDQVLDKINQENNSCIFIEFYIKVSSTITNFVTEIKNRFDTKDDGLKYQLRSYSGEFDFIVVPDGESANQNLIKFRKMLCDLKSVGRLETSVQFLIS